MARTTTAAMAAHLAGTAHARNWMIRMDLWDGTVIGLTSYDKDVPFDLGDAAGLVTYLKGHISTISDVELVANFEASSFEFSGAFDDLVTLAAVAGGRFNGAEVRLFQCTPEFPSSGPIRILLGEISEARPEGGVWTFEVQGEAYKFAQTVGEVMTTQCILDFGSELCGQVPETITGTVIDVIDDMTVRFSFSGSYADDYFNFGKVNWLTGELTDTRKIEIYDWTSTGWLTLYYPLADLPQIGDTAEISRGCSKARRSTDPTVPTCASYNNLAPNGGLRFDGFPDLTGTDQLLRPTIPGQGNDPE